MKLKSLIAVSVLSLVFLTNSNYAIAATSARTQQLIDRANQRVAELRLKISQRQNSKYLKAPIETAKASQPIEVSASLSERKIIELTNLERQKFGLPALVENANLGRAAEIKAKDMLQNQYFAHVSPNGIDLSQLLKSAGYKYSVAGENLIVGDLKSESEVVAKWMASPGHRQNILDDRFTQIGVSIIKGTYQGRTVWMGVQEFGAPSI